MRRTYEATTVKPHDTDVFEEKFIRHNNELTCQSQLVFI